MGKVKGVNQQQRGLDAKYANQNSRVIRKDRAYDSAIGNT
jgi:nuclear GTP-binding protein